LLPKPLERLSQSIISESSRALAIWVIPGILPRDQKESRLPEKAYNNLSPAQLVPQARKRFVKKLVSSLLEMPRRAD